MQAAGNDFIIIDKKDFPALEDNNFIKKICDRHFGVGCDQLLIVDDNGGMTIFNTDGSTSKQCGNGLRAVAAYLVLKNNPQATESEVTIKNEAGTVKAKVALEAKKINVGVEMPVPIWESKRIPVATEGDPLHLELSYAGLKDPSAVSLGNPHLVFFVENLQEVQIYQVGSVLSTNPMFPEGTNVMIAQIKNPNHIELKIWERGVGPTLACGSGATATVAAAHRRGLCSDNVTIKMPGGEVQILISDSGVFTLYGEVNVVFRGKIELSTF